MKLKTNKTSCLRYLGVLGFRDDGMFSLASSFSFGHTYCSHLPSLDAALGCTCSLKEIFRCDVWEGYVLRGESRKFRLRSPDSRIPVMLSPVLGCRVWQQICAGCYTLVYYFRATYSGGTFRIVLRSPPTPPQAPPHRSCGPGPYTWLQGSTCS